MNDLFANAVLVRERERPQRARSVLPRDEVLDVIGDLERALLDVGPAHGRVRHALRAEELREMQEPAHPARVRPAMDLEQELLSDRRREQVGVMRSSPEPWFDADPGERAAGDLIGRLGDLVPRGRDGERAHGQRRI